MTIPEYILAGMLIPLMLAIYIALLYIIRHILENKKK